VLRKGGVLVSGLDIGINYIFDLEERVLTNTLPFNPLKNEEHLRQMQDSNGGVQFSHTIEEQINGQLEAGFALTNLYDDTNDFGNLHKHNVAYKIMQEHEKRYRYYFPRPWTDFMREVSLRAGDIDKKTLQNKLVEINNYDDEFRRTLHPIFISHMRYGKTRGSGHGEQIYKKPYKDDGRIIQHKSIYDISPDDIESSPIATSDRKLYELLKDTFSKIELKGNAL